MRRLSLRRARLVLVTIILLLTATPAQAQFGVVLSGAGPINRSMGGAAVGAPLDASGALYWNPATIGGLRRSEVELGAELITPRARLGSSVPAGAVEVFEWENLDKPFGAKVASVTADTVRWFAGTEAVRQADRRQ